MTRKLTEMNISGPLIRRVVANLDGYFALRGLDPVKCAQDIVDELARWDGKEWRRNVFAIRATGISELPIIRVLAIYQKRVETRCAACSVCTATLRLGNDWYCRPCIEVLGGLADDMLRDVGIDPAEVQGHLRGDTERAPPRFR